MPGIVFIHGTGSRPSPVVIARERSEFVEGVRSSLLAIGALLFAMARRGLI